MPKNESQTTYAVVYKNKTVPVKQAKTLEELFRGIEEISNELYVEPVAVIVPTGETIPYKWNYFNQCFNVGSFNEECLINMLKEKGKEVCHV